MTAPNPRSFAKIYGAPTALAIVSIVGLLSALLGDGIWDAVSWVSLDIPLAVIIWFRLRAGR
jgi:hypothetical protein